MMMVPATVAERDHKKGVRFKVADGTDGPVLSSWVRPPDWNTGVRSSHLPRVGSQAMLFTPPGGDRTLTYMPIGHHDGSEDPASTADETVLFDDGECRISINDGKVTIRSGGSRVVVSGDNVEVMSKSITTKGESLKHNAKEIGDGHKHMDVVPGGGISGVPV